MNCIWFKSLDCRYTWAQLNTHFSSSYIGAQCSCHTAAERLMHKAATLTFSNPHIAQAINTKHQLMKPKRKRRKIPHLQHHYL